MANEFGKEDVEKAINDNEPDVDYSKLDPEKIPHNVVERTGAFSGLLGETRTLRDTNQSLRDQNNLLVAKGEQDEPDEFAERDPDDPITLGDAQKMVESAVEKDRKVREAESERAEQNQAKTRRTESESKVMEKYAKGKVPDGLEAETVMRAGGAWLMHNKPEIFKAAYAGSDPAQEIYDLALSLCPQFKGKQNAAQGAQLLDSLGRGTLPKSGAAVNDESMVDMNELDKVLNMSEDQLLAAAEIEELG